MSLLDQESLTVLSGKGSETCKISPRDVILLAAMLEVGRLSVNDDLAKSYVSAASKISLPLLEEASKEYRSTLLRDRNSKDIRTYLDAEIAKRNR